MQNELRVNGNQEFMGLEIPVIEGGFGEHKRIVTIKTVSTLHNLEIKEVTKSINRLIEKERLKENVDYIDLKPQVNSLPMNIEEVFGIKQEYLSRTQNIFILSERGYTKLIKAMDDDTSWDVMDKFIDSYFVMKEIILSDEQLKANLLLSIYSGGQEGILAAKQLADIEVKVATTPLLEKIEEQTPLVEFADHVSKSTDTIDIGKMAKIAKDENINIGRNRLFEYLRSNKILMKDNTPYQRYLENKWFEVIEGFNHTAYGDKFWTKTLVTGKGQISIIEMLRKEFCKVTN